MVGVYRDESEGEYKDSKEYLEKEECKKEFFRLRKFPIPSRITINDLSYLLETKPFYPHKSNEDGELKFYTKNRIEKIKKILFPDLLDY